MVPFHSFKFHVPFSFVKTTVADPHHFDADTDPDPFHFVADPDPACHFFADPDPTFHFDPDPNVQLKAQNLEKVLKYGHFPYILDCLL
jgi:hypothetical protein